MVASSGEVALCEHIIFQHFGAAVGLVASILLARGRLSYETLLRLAPRSLKQSTVQASILVLVQHNCLYHVLDEEEGFEYYEVNVQEILERRKFGTYLAMTREIWDKDRVPAEVVSSVLAEGKIRLSTLIEDLTTSSPSTSSAPFDSARHSKVVKAIFDLTQLGILRPVTRADQTSTSDQDLQYEKQLMRKLSGPASAKELRDILEQVAERRAELDGQIPDWGKDLDAYDDLCRSIKEDEAAEAARDASSYSELDARPSEHNTRKRKAASVSHSSSSKAKRWSMPFDDSKYVRVAYTPFHIRLRNELVVKAVRAQRGGAAAVLVQSILAETVNAQKSLSEPCSEFVSTARLVRPANRQSPSRKTVPLPGTSDINGSHPEEDVPQHAFYTLFPSHPIQATFGLEPTGRWAPDSKEPVDLLNEMVHHLHNTADARPKLVAFSEEYRKFSLLPEEVRANSWLSCSDPNAARQDWTNLSGGRLSWAVDFAMAHEKLKIGLVESYLLSRFGKEATRLWRILDAKGKMEEKQIAKVAMLPVKEVRELIVGLSSAGFIRQQEVPRTADRNPSRTFFLWYVSKEACYQLLLSRLYDTLINLHVRQEEEMSRNRALLRRSERRDVRENRGLLDKGDQDELNTLDWKIESLRISMERVDRDLFILDTLPTIEVT